MAASHQQAVVEPPPLRHSVTEIARSLTEIGSSFALNPWTKTLPRGDGHSVMTLPGYLGSDGSTSRLRKQLASLGYHTLPWGLGRNVGNTKPKDMDDFLAHRRQLENKIAEQVEAEFHRSGGKVTLIGWSLGGLYAVALAHRHPQWIRQVITLGTPYGDPRGTAVYNLLKRWFHNTKPVDEAALERWINYNYQGGDLQVPILALHSKTDGIVGTSIAQCYGDRRFVRNRAIPASHVGFPFNPLVFVVVANYLAPRHRRWPMFRFGKYL